MDHYEGIREYCHGKATVQLKFGHIGGNQLTREQYSGAKELRIWGSTAFERFDNLSPILDYVKFILLLTVAKNCSY